MLATQTSYLQERRIQAEDLVIAYVSPQAMRGVYVKADPEHIVQFISGTYHTQDWIGMKFGCTVYPRKHRPGIAPLFLLAPTPELWTRVLHHRTQILYIADISLICSFLELCPGRIVLESGTGSGSLTHALARAVAPTGHVHTFEFHEQRCQKATEEFQKHGLSEVITLAHRDIQSLGFPEMFKTKVHGVFLDLPEPWEAIQSAVDCLLPGYSIVTFSPCIEQIQRSCNVMQETGQLMDIRVMECLAKEYKVKEEHLITDLESYHQSKSSSKSNKSKKRKDEAAQEVECDGTSAVLNARTVGSKGHTGFLTVARKIVK
eukprot:g8757.t1